MIRIIFLSVFFVLLTLSNSQSECPDVSKLKELIGKTVILRKVVGNSTILYPMDSSFYLRITDNRTYLYRENQLISIQNVRCLDTIGILIEIAFENYLLGKQKIYIRTLPGISLSSTQLDTAVATMFVADTNRDNFIYYSRCRSGLIHSTLCNHKCVDQELLDHSFAPTDNHDSLCASCFDFLPLVSDIDVETALSNNFASYCFSNFRQVSDPSAITKVEAAASAVLENWPLTLIGYRYRFILIDSDEPNATACPGGTIFITTGLLRMIDSPKELVAILCHEIAHVELRHGYRQFKKEQTEGKWMSVFGAFLGAAAGAAVENGTESSTAGVITYEFIKAATDMAATISARGYSREYEREADRMVEIFSLKQHDRSIKDAFVTVLRKLQYHDHQLPDINQTKTLDTHPPLTERIMITSASQSSLFEPVIEYKGYDKNNNVVATLRLIATSEFLSTNLKPTINGPSKATSVQNTVLFGEILTTPYLQDESVVKQLSFGGAQCTFDNKADTRILPTQKSGLIFYNEAIEPISCGIMPGDTLVLSLSLKNIREWKRVQ